MITRRGFLGRAWRWTGASLLLGSGLALQRTLGCASRVPSRVVLDDPTVARLRQDGFVVLDEVVLSGTPEAPRALSRRCTHLGCTLDVDTADGTFICPCHGGRFDREGRVLTGPPKTPLDEVPVRREGDRWVVGGTG